MTPADAWAVADPTTCDVCGRDACEEHLPTPVPVVVPRVGFRSALSISDEPPPIEIVEGAAWGDSLSVLVSESGTGKTFLLLSLSAAISDGVNWLRRDVLQGSVAYCSYEGDALGVRLRALRATSGSSLAHLFILRAHDPISPKVTREGEERSPGEVRLAADLETLAADLAAAGQPPIRLLVIDTVRASMTGSEDGSDHVSAYLRAVRRIMTLVPGAAVILAHHAGWQDGETQKKRERGSSSWRGNVDGTLYLEAGAYDATRGEAELILKTLKSRDGEKPPALHCIRRRVCLNETDRRGQPVTSCVIEPDCRTREDREAEASAVAELEHQALDLRTLRVIAEHPEASTSQDKLRLRVGVKRDVAYGSLSRVVQRGWAREPDRQRQPYTVTPAGRQALSEAPA